MVFHDRLESALAFIMTLASLSGCGDALPEDEPVVPTPTDVGTPTGTAVSATIGAAGGTLETADGRFAVVIPPGALASDTAISIQPITNMAHGGRGDGYDLSPDGLTFAQPVELRWMPTEDDLDGAALEYADIHRQDAEGYWEELGATRDAAAGTVSVTTSHFSHYSPSITLYVVPDTANVEVESFRAFHVWLCSSEYVDPMSGRRTTICRRWESAAAARSLGDWSVNGIVGGNARLGTATYTGPGSMSYEAPAEVPSDNPVRVSVSVRNYRDRPVAPLVSRVRITGVGQPYDGTVTWDSGPFSEGDGVRSTATVQFAVANTLTSYTDYTASGSVEMEVRSPDCTPMTVTLPLLTSEAFSRLTVYRPGDSSDAFDYSFVLSTDVLEGELQCSGGGGPFTRPVNISASISCSGIPYTDAATLSLADDSRCSGISNVTASFIRQ